MKLSLYRNDSPVLEYHVEEADGEGLIASFRQAHALRSGGWVEYPKWIDKDGKPVLVQSAEEEEALSRDEPVARPEDERARLIKVAEVKDVQIDKRWSLERIAKAIEDAGHDPSLNPFA